MKAAPLEIHDFVLLGPMIFGDDEGSSTSASTKQNLKFMGNPPRYQPWKVT
jgi:hypothetical protein